jgi:hypothetical protein
MSMLTVQLCPHEMRECLLGAMLPSSERICLTAISIAMSFARLQPTTAIATIFTILRVRLVGSHTTFIHNAVR